MKKFGSSLVLPANEKKDWKVNERLVWSTLLFHFVAGILETFWFSRVLNGYQHGRLLLFFLPESLHVTLFYFLGELPLTCSISVTFSLVIVTTFHVLWIFYDFCDTFQKQIEIYNEQVPFDHQSQMGFVSQTFGEVSDFSVFSVATTVVKIQKQNRTPLGIDKMMGKLEHLKLVCGQYDKICGPLLLGLIVRAVYVLISTANSILLYDNTRGDELSKRAKHWLDLFIFFTELVQLWLLPMGALFRNKINKRKENLSRTVIFMRDLEARTDLRNVMTAFCEWDWTLTGGPGFFVVDKSLLSGVNQECIFVTMKN